MELSRDFYRRLAEILLEIPATREIILQATEGGEKHGSEDVSEETGQGN